MNNTELVAFLGKGVLKWNFVEDITDIEEEQVIYYVYNSLSRVHTFVIFESNIFLS